MKKGFTIIEVVLAIFLATLISLSLFQLLNQARKAVRRITNVIEVDLPLISFYNQVQKDVTGMFTPASTLEFFIDKDAKAVKEKEQEKFSNFSRKKDEAPVTLVSKPIEQIFELEVKPEQFFWSFITTGGIQQLDSDGVAAPVPLVRRVAYLLENDPQRPGLYRLMYRFSGTQLEIEPFKAAGFSPSYELIHGIRQLSIELTIYEVASEPESEQPQQEGRQKKEQPKPPVKTTKNVSLKEWKSDEIWATYKTLLPAYVKLSGIRVDSMGREYPFEMLYKVYAYNPYVKKEKSLFEALEDIAKQIWKKK